MMSRIASLAACVALVMPVGLFAQTTAEEDGAVDLNTIDSLLGDRVITGDEDMDEDAAAEDAAIADGEAAEEEGGDEASDDEAVEDDDAPEPSDLTLAFNAYSLCALEAGFALEETGFALDQIGDEALLRCAGQRAAYVNAFYFSLLPRYPDAPEADVRASAERLVAQTDIAISNMVVREVTIARETRAPDADTTDEPDPDTEDGETAEDETETDAQD